MKKAVEKKFGDQYPLHKEDCIRHIQKRMGTALRNYKNKSKGSKPSDGKGVGGAGQLTNSTIDHMQTYYRYTIRNNKGNTEEVQKAIWPIYYHMIPGPESDSKDEQHRPGSWCKYQRDHMTNTNNYDRKKCLPFVFRELKHIFVRLFSSEILSKCQCGLTQNQNKSPKSFV